MLVWLKANQSDRTSFEFVGVRNDERDILGTPCCHLPDLQRHRRSREERIIAVLWVLVLCPLYLVTYSLHGKNKSTIKSGSGARLNKELQDFVSYKVPRVWVSIEDVNNKR